MARLLKYFIVGFLAGFALFFVAFAFFNPLGEAAAMAAVAGFVYGLFCIGFMTRLMATATLVINPSNKDPQKGLAWYAEEIRQQMADMRFKKVGGSTSFEVYHPRGFSKVWERKVELSVDPYEVKVMGSRVIIRILSDLVEIKPQLKKGEATRP